MAEEPMLELFAGNRVSDYERAKEWYVRLLGAEPSFLAHATEAIWQLADHASVFIVEVEHGAGGAIHTVVVDDLDERVAAIAARGIQPDETETYSNGVRNFFFRHTAAYEIGFGGMP